MTTMAKGTCYLHAGTLALLVVSLAVSCARTAPETGISSATATLEPTVQPQGTALATAALPGGTSVPAETSTPVPAAAEEMMRETASVPAELEPTASVTPIAMPTPTLLPTDTPPAPAAPSFPPVIGLEPLHSGFQHPVYLTHAGDPSWFLVVEQVGRVRLVENGVAQPELFLDITGRVRSQASEQGLLSLAFPPAELARGEFYANYTSTEGDTIVARFRLRADDSRLADPDSEHIVLQVAQPATNHNGGQLQFGPDGMLYVGMGDGGRAGDPWGNAQNGDTLLGKLLRLDVRAEDGYRVPEGNPFVGQAGMRPEIWALGLRNPWRFSFDRGTGDLYIADVGQNLYEEVHWQAAGSPGGQNYGWDILEGTHCFEPPSACDTAGLEMPIAEYGHEQGCSVTGGYVYRGSRYPQMNGVYFYGDFCSGNIWGLRRLPSGEWQQALLLASGKNISSFGEDAAGELYVLSYTEGAVLRVTAVE